MPASLTDETGGDSKTDLTEFAFIYYTQSEITTFLIIKLIPIPTFNGISSLFCVPFY